MVLNGVVLNGVVVSTGFEAFLQWRIVCNGVKHQDGWQRGWMDRQCK